jgi:hypothetical protein
MQVQIFNAPSGQAQEVAPFFFAYSSKLNKDNNDVLWTSTLVLRVPWTTKLFAIIKNPYGPAEW